MKTLAIIPVRYGSTRLPGKPLAMIGDMPMMQHVYNQVSQAVRDVVIACDDERIAKVAEEFGATPLLTSSGISTGTDRVCVAAKAIIGELPDTEDYIIVNMQGDEPFIEPDDISKLVDTFLDPSVEIATLATKYDPADGFDTLFNPNNVKVTFDSSGNALYFSRSIIPYVRNTEWKQWVNSADFYIHTGIYAFRYPTLMKLCALQPTSLELAESLEQLRWLQNGFKVRVAVTTNKTVGIDTPEDLAKANEIWNNRTV